MEVFVKGDPASSTLGDCPFCHRVLLTFEEKGVPYTKGYINFANKPEWLLQVNPDGTVPVGKDTASGEWVVGSGTIVDWAEGKFPERALGAAEAGPDAGVKVFPAFAAFFKAPPAEAAEKEAALLAELRGLEAHLAAGGPYLAGADVCSADCSLAPKLHHMVTALGGLKGWQLPAEFVAIRRYLEAMKARPSWAATRYADEAVLSGWKAKLPAA